MPRRNVPRRSVSPRTTGARPLGSVGWATTDTGADGQWLVRTVPSAQTIKGYRCPGCDHEVRPGTAHVVVWPADESGSVEDRRHWHNGCWAARTRRGPTRRR